LSGLTKEFWSAEIFYPRAGFQNYARRPASLAIQSLVLKKLSDTAAFSRKQSLDKSPLLADFCLSRPAENDTKRSLNRRVLGIDMLRLGDM
jgi:hypothetical protein